MLQIIQDAEQLLEMSCGDCRLRGMTEESIRRYRSSLNIFLKFLRREGISIDGVDVQALRRFLQHIKFERGASHKTVENYSQLSQPSMITSCSRDYSARI